MKRLIVSIILLFAITFSTASCLNVTRTVPTITKSAESTSASATVNSLPVGSFSADILAEKKTFSAVELGIDNIASSYFYWSPSSEYVVFIGSVKDTNGKYTSSVYLLRLQDKKIIKIIEGDNDKNYYMNEPRWSDDGMMLTVPFYELQDNIFPIRLYYIDKEKLDVLPVTGATPSISPDKNKIAYFGKNNELSVYDLSEKAETLMPGNIKGRDPLWFSDNKRLIFIKRTGKYPPGEDWSEFEYRDICILDTTDPKNAKMFGYESMLRKLTWIIKDVMVWIEYGADDGFFVEALDVYSSKLTDFGDAGGKSYQVDSKNLNFIIYDNKSGYRLLDRNMKELGLFTINMKDRILPGPALSVLSGDSLLYFENSTAGTNGTIMMSFLNQQKYIKYDQLSDIKEPYYPKASRDRMKIALLYDDGKEFLLLIYKNAEFITTQKSG